MLKPSLPPLLLALVLAFRAGAGAATRQQFERAVMAKLALRF